MNRSIRRVQLTPGYLLHQRPYRDSSRIIEVFTREFGRLTLFARAVRGGKSALGSVLQPFQLLLFSFSGRGDAAQLTGAEVGRPCTAVLAQTSLMPAFYANELLLKLLTRDDPAPVLFDAYAELLDWLHGAKEVQAGLRIFEKRLLDAIGLGLDLVREASGGTIEPDTHYRYLSRQGIVAAGDAAGHSVRGDCLLALAREDVTRPGQLTGARAILRAAIDDALEGRPLATRQVARELHAIERTDGR
ncbi:MAG: DNA repair protein RecO [Steroidobacteraceae bacterium]